MSQQVLTQYAPLVKVTSTEVIPAAAIGGQTRDGKDEIITGAGNMVFVPTIGDNGMWVPVSEANPLETRVRQLETLLGPLNAAKETNPDAASATLLALIRGLMSAAAKEATLAAIKDSDGIKKIADAVTVSGLENLATAAKQDTIKGVLDTLATESTLASILGKLDDPATETTLAAAKGVLDTIAGKDFATQTTLASLASAVATEATLGDVKTAVAALAALISDGRLKTEATITGQYWDRETERPEDVEGIGGAPFAALMGSNKKPISRANPMPVAAAPMSRVSVFSRIVGDDEVHSLTVRQVVPVIADTTISSASASRNSNNGAFPLIIVTSSQQRRGLLRVSRDDIANRDLISSATLWLYADPGTSFDTPGRIDVHVIAQDNGDWIEGTKSNAAADPGEPTWNNKAHPDTAWVGGPGLGNPGEGYASDPIGSLVYDKGEGWRSISLDVEAFRSSLESPINSGLILVSDGGEARFHSRENTNAPYVELTIGGSGDWIYLEADASGARIVDLGDDGTGPGVEVPVTGVLIPARTKVPYGLFVPTGVTVTYYFLGVES